MSTFRRIAVIESMVEARVLDSMLNEQGIPHVMKSYQDSAYDGVFQGSMGWGHIEASDEHEPEILALLKSLRSGEGGTQDGADG
jgi:hypothetical protein